MKMAMLSPDSTSITEESGRSHTNPIVGEGVMLKSVRDGFSVSALVFLKVLGVWSGDDYHTHRCNQKLNFLNVN
jgi:hypothetical protein